jgi:hypothetical protein
VSVAGVRAEEDVMVSSSEPGPPVNGRRVRPAGDWRLGPERIAELLAVAEAANMALLVLEAAARSARDDLESVLRSVDAIDQQKRPRAGPPTPSTRPATAPPGTCAPSTGSPRRPAARSGRRWRRAAPTPAKPPWNSSTPGPT